jgi:hypothetical protein
MYRKYRDDTTNDMNDKLKEKVNKIAEGIANNVKDALKVG